MVAQLVRVIMAVRPDAPGRVLSRAQSIRAHQSHDDCSGTSAWRRRAAHSVQMCRFFILYCCCRAVSGNDAQSRAFGGIADLEAIYGLIDPLKYEIMEAQRRAP